MGGRGSGYRVATTSLIQRDHCSAPFPWVSRQGRIYELMNLLEEEELDAATELDVREQLEALRNPKLDEKRGGAAVEARQGCRARALAEVGRAADPRTVVSASIKAQLGVG